MFSTANITMQFAAKPLFENISVKFGDGNRYGLIGANGCGKSTFMKILDGSLVPTAGNVSISPNERLGRLNQDQFAYEQYSVIDTPWTNSITKKGLPALTPPGSPVVVPPS